MSLDTARFFAAFARHGLLRVANYTPPETGIPIETNVGYIEPYRRYLGATTASKDYEIEYAHAAMPNLAEGHTITVGGVTFRVRETPFVPEFDREGADGTWRRALLTKV
jgi:hypothetical protein